jgi:oxygen-independent coproporphyrinogen-3 oxidase
LPNASRWAEAVVAKRVIPIAAAGHPGRIRRPAGLRFTAPPPLALYIHIPWCVRKCPYCDFNSHEVRDGIPEDAYVEALIADLESALPLVWGRRIEAIFIGGGTPSLFSPAAFERLLTRVRMLLPVQPGAEITLEANPGTLEADHFAAFRDAGITRLSLGIQSFDGTQLHALGRIHDAAEARRAAELAARHFPTFNLDLMYGLPRQDLAGALRDIEVALEFAPPHLSCYQLTLEANTRFAAAPPPLPEADLCADMQEAIEMRLAAAGYVNYETSAFAQAGHRCRHNLNYWHFGDYLGIGAGAHGKLTLHDHGDWKILRQVRWKQPKQYLDRVAAGTPIREEHAVSAMDLPFEFMLNALRLAEGFAMPLFEQRTGCPWSAVAPAIADAEGEGLITIDGQRAVPTARGRRMLNRLLEKFLPEA